MFSNFAILDLSTPNLVIILGIILLLFGSKKLPELSRSLGQSAKELRNGLNEASTTKDEITKTVSNSFSEKNNSVNQ